MDIRWDDYVGREVNGFPLLTLLGVRDGRGYFLTRRSGEEALLQAGVFDAGQLERWSRAAGLSHPGLLAIFTAGDLQLDEESPRMVYAVSPIPDDDLGEQLARGAFDRTRTANLATDLANVLDYLHGQQLKHGRVAPPNVFFVKGTVRLAADSIESADEAARREDVRQLGITIAAAVGGTADERLQTIISGTQSADPAWTAGRVLQELAEPLTPVPPPRREPPAAATPAPVEPVQRPAPVRHAWVWITAVAVAVIGLAIFVAARSRREPQVGPPAAQAQRPTMFGKPEAPAAVSAPARTRPAPARPGWAVIAATYAAYRGAEKRAAAIRERWPQFQPVIHPAAGEGRKYYVLLGSGLTKQQAEHLYRRARQAGMPSDTYVTRIGGE